MSFLKQPLFFYMAIVVPSAVLVPLTVTAIRYKRLSPPIRLIGLYVLLSAITNVVANYMAVHRMNNLNVINVYNILETLVFTEFYVRIFGKGSIIRYLRITQVAFLLLAFADMLWLQKTGLYNTYTKSVEAIIIMAYAIYYFAQELEQVGTKQRSSKAVTYINGGLLLYFSGSLILFILTGLLRGTRAYHDLNWAVHATLLLALYLLIAVVIWMYEK